MARPANQLRSAAPALGLLLAWVGAAYAEPVGGYSLPPFPRDPNAQLGDDPTQAALVESLVQQLDSADWGERDIADTTLRNISLLTLKDLEKILAERQLSTEQRARLMDIAQLKFVTSPRAAMGIGFFTEVDNRVILERTMERFPAFSILQPGDMIVSVNGIALKGPLSRRTIQSQIISRDPGDALHLVIRRGAEKLEVDVPLGSYENLTQGGTSLGILIRAWNARINRFAPEVTRASVEGVPENCAWRRVRAGQTRGAGAIAPPTEAAPPGSRFTSIRPAGGGASRQVGADGLEWNAMGAQVIFRNNRGIVVDPRRGFAAQAQMGGFDPFDTPIPAPESDAQIVKRLESIEQRLAAETEGADDNPGAENVVVRPNPVQPANPFGASIPPAEQLRIVRRAIAAIRAQQAEDAAGEAQAQVDAQGG